ncbi:enterochelin esterase [Pseudoduganella eburnea]|uniref:Enterochelin esterase n=1 Tax=Massilia eburnea TaxID=1776165 RepID=A0A6L6QKP4_9BURK|nr:alpha/beta hydrolase-fold protein [Massilia eburnea]MTW12755.1 enterochelin esterase [Massilia eburnea]
MKIAPLPLLLLLAGALSAQVATAADKQFMTVQLDAGAKQATQGRLLVFAREAKSAEAEAMEKSKEKSSEVTVVDADPFSATSTAVTAREVSRLQPGQSIAVDGDDLAFPLPYSQLPPGDYYVQAVLDVDHSYNYTGRSAGDWVSDVVKVHLPAATVPTIRLAHILRESDPWKRKSETAEERAGWDATRQHSQPIDFPSPALSAFWGRQVKMPGWVLTPPGYDAKAKVTYPTVYYTHGFGANAARLVPLLAEIYGAMAAGKMPPMIWVVLDESSPTGTHEFADSVNNGPWGQALTTELMPYLEKHYRMDAKPTGRFLNGHSSGGWATLWLQTRYPKLFGGTWSTSPDPSDFHDFTGVDLYAQQANVFRKADGGAYPLVRDHDKVMGTFEQFAKLERVLGSYGGQLASMEWVFSPRGQSGAPQPMFDRDTGDVDPSVVAYWRDNFDIAYRTKRDWPQVKADLDGKIHLIVGTADTFYLDGAAHKFKAVMDGLNAKTDFRFIPDRTHFDLYKQGDDKLALLHQISWEMYSIARPKSALKSSSAKAGK